MQGVEGICVPQALAFIWTLLCALDVPAVYARWAQARLAQRAGGPEGVGGYLRPLTVARSSVLAVV